MPEDKRPPQQAEEPKRPEREKGQDPRQSTRTPDSEPPKDKRSDDL